MVKVKIVWTTLELESMLLHIWKITKDLKDLVDAESAYGYYKIHSHSQKSLESIKHRFEYTLREQFEDHYSIPPLEKVRMLHLFGLPINNRLYKQLEPFMEKKTRKQLEKEKIETKRSEIGYYGSASFRVRGQLITLLYKRADDSFPCSDEEQDMDEDTHLAWLTENQRNAGNERSWHEALQHRPVSTSPSEEKKDMHRVYLEDAIWEIFRTCVMGFVWIDERSQKLREEVLKFMIRQRKLEITYFPWGTVINAISSHKELWEHGHRFECFESYDFESLSTHDYIHYAQKLSIPFVDQNTLALEEIPQKSRASVFKALFVYGYAEQFFGNSVNLKQIVLDRTKKNLTLDSRRTLEPLLAKLSCPDKCHTTVENSGQQPPLSEGQKPDESNTYTPGPSTESQPLTGIPSLPGTSSFYRDFSQYLACLKNFSKDEEDEEETFQTSETSAATTGNSENPLPQFKLLNLSERDTQGPSKNSPPVAKKQNLTAASKDPSNVSKLKKAEKFETLAGKATALEKRLKESGKRVVQLEKDITSMEMEKRKSDQRERELIERNEEFCLKIRKLEEQLKNEQQERINREQENATLRHGIQKIQLNLIRRHSKATAEFDEQIRGLKAVNQVLLTCATSLTSSTSNGPQKLSDQPSTSHPDFSQRPRFVLHQWQKFKDTLTKDTVLEQCKAMVDQLISTAEELDVKQYAEYEKVALEGSINIYLQTVEINIAKIKKTEDITSLLPLPEYPRLSEKFLKHFQKELEKEPEPLEVGFDKMETCSICQENYLEGEEKQFCDLCGTPVHAHCGEKWKSTQLAEAKKRFGAKCGWCIQEGEKKDKT